MDNRIEKIFAENAGDIAVIVGNGINRYGSPNGAKYAWDVLVKSLWKRLSKNKIPNEKKGLSLTEAYDIINLSSEGDSEVNDLVKKFVKKIKPTDYQGRLCQRMKERGIPILTTNFDGLLESSMAGATKHFMSLPGKKASFTTYYPWNVYYDDKPKDKLLQSPADGFGIWHINGMVEYLKSMRLGLTHYMAQVSRVLSFKKEHAVFDSKGAVNQSWKGYATWLHLVFNCPLLIFGLSLDVNETFLRWLLIEREKSFGMKNVKRKGGWFLCLEEEIAKYPGKMFFLNYLGFEIITFKTRDALYESVLQ